jgi:hypothetical protein
MTESSSKGLTWATFTAGVGGAVLLAAIGCLKPGAADEDSSRVRSERASSGDNAGPQARFVSQESLQRARGADLHPSLRH